MSDTELEMAEQFGKTLLGKFIWVPELKNWYSYNGHVWAKTSSEKVIHHFHNFLRELSMNGDRNKVFQARKYETNSKAKAVCESIKSMNGILIEFDQLDGKPDLLNFRNGTLNLKTNEFYSGVASDYLTQSMACDYKPAAECPQWQKFVLEISSNREDQARFLQKMSGYSLTTDNSQQKFFCLMGTGANGKGVFARTVQGIMGSYAQQAAQEFLAPKRSGNASEELARMRSVRLSIYNEVGSDLYISTSLLKQITGEDIVAARYLYKSHIEFIPMTKLVMLCNGIPCFTSHDAALDRRMEAIPFDQDFSSNPDLNLKKKLMTEASGIVNWMLEGLRLFRKEGLTAPPSIRSKTLNVISSLSSIKRFTEERCEIGKDFSVNSSELYAAYSDFCTFENIHRMNHQTFSQQLIELGFMKKKSSNTQWFGLKLKGEKTAPELVLG